MLGLCIRSGSDYYETSDFTQRGECRTLIVPDPYFGIKIHDIDDVEEYIVKLLKEPTTMLSLLDKCQAVCDDDVVKDYYDQYCSYMTGVVRDLVRKRAVCPARLNKKNAEITVDSISNIVAPPEREPLCMYDMLKGMLPLMEAFSRLYDHTFYVYDYSQQRIIYISEHQVLPVGMRRDQIKQMGYYLFFNFMPSDEHYMLKNIAKYGNEILLQHKDVEKLNSVLAYKLNMDIESQRYLVHISKTPVMLNDSGGLWLALFTVSIAKHGTPGDAFFYVRGSSHFQKFSHKKIAWVSHEVPVISDYEKQILALAALGLRRKDIAASTCKSEQTVKSHISMLCKKFKTDCILGCVDYALSLNII